MKQPPFYGGSSPSKKIRSIPNPPAEYLAKIHPNPYGRHCHCGLTPGQDHSSTIEHDHITDHDHKYTKQYISRTPVKHQNLDFINMPLKGILNHIYSSITTPSRKTRDVSDNDGQNQNGKSNTDFHYSEKANSSVMIDDYSSILSDIPSLEKPSFDITKDQMDTITIEDIRDFGSGKNDKSIQVPDLKDARNGYHSDIETKTNVTKNDDQRNVVRDERGFERETLMEQVQYEHKLIDILDLIRKMRKEHCICDSKNRLMKRMARYQYSKTNNELKQQREKNSVFKKKEDYEMNVHVPKAYAKYHDFDIEPSRREFYRDYNETSQQYSHGKARK